MKNIKVNQCNKAKGYYREMAWLPFQKEGERESEREKDSERVSERDSERERVSRI